MHAAADIASFDAAVALNEGGTGTAHTTVATTGASGNGWNNVNGTLAINNPPKSGTHQDSKAVEVILTQNLPRDVTAYSVSSAV